MSCVLVHIGSHRLVIELPPCPWSTTGLQRPYCAVVPRRGGPMNRPYRAGLTWCTAGVSVAGPCTSFHPSTLGMARARWRRQLVSLRLYHAGLYHHHKCPSTGVFRQGRVTAAQTRGRASAAAARFLPDSFPLAPVVVQWRYTLVLRLVEGTLTGAARLPRLAALSL